MSTKQKFWIGDVGDHNDSTGRPYDSFDAIIGDEFIDGRTIHRGAWAIMSPVSWREHGCGQLGTGYGQRYKRQADGRWLKVEG